MTVPRKNLHSNLPESHTLLLHPLAKLLPPSISCTALFSAPLSFTGRFSPEAMKAKMRDPGGRSIVSLLLWLFVIAFMRLSGERGKEGPA